MHIYGLGHQHLPLLLQAGLEHPPSTLHGLAGGQEVSLHLLQDDFTEIAPVWVTKSGSLPPAAAQAIPFGHDGFFSLVTTPTPTGLMKSS